MKSFMLLVLAATAVFGAAVTPRADGEIDWSLVKQHSAPARAAAVRDWPWTFLVVEADSGSTEESHPSNPHGNLDKTINFHVTTIHPNVEVSSF
ncbi:hypothetical protein CcaCcLH18_12702 [Colletotrichum camelliae]|nr:hypothetical protein CcaCcLH18_12702 [Colletotrichum camelliae]